MFHLYKVVRTVFEKCEAEFGGAIYLQNDAYFVSIQNIFKDCVANDHGGAISTTHTVTKLSCCTFFRNSAPSQSATLITCDKNYDSIFQSNSYSEHFLFPSASYTSGGTATVMDSKLFSSFMNNSFNTANHIAAVKIGSSYTSYMRYFNIYNTTSLHINFQLESNLEIVHVQKGNFIENKSNNSGIFRVVYCDATISEVILSGNIGTCQFVSSYGNIELYSCFSDKTINESNVTNINPTKQEVYKFVSLECIITDTKTGIRISLIPILSILMYSSSNQ